MRFLKLFQELWQSGWFCEKLHITTRKQLFKELHQAFKALLYTYFFNTLEAYEAVRSWYQNILEHINPDDSEYYRKSFELINALPSTNSISTLEIRDIFHQIISGKLEWAYSQSDGHNNMSEYAKSSLKNAG